jgi:pyruvate dehydrogenase E2 component (dihydrolipoamide acetyltransferase)
MPEFSVKKLDWAERWLRDGLEISQLPTAVKIVEIDMTKATESICLFRAEGHRVTFTHLILRAAALALARNPDLNVMLSGNRRLYPTTVRIGVSVATDSFVAPVLVIAEPDRKRLITLAREMAERKDRLVAESEERLKRLRRWGWLIPFSFARRSILRYMARNFEFRQKLSGTIQVTSLRRSDISIPLTFGSTAILGVGRVRERVVAVDGRPTVKSTLNLTCTADHRVWDGMAGEKFMGEIKRIIESGAYDEVTFATDRSVKAASG